MGSVLRPDALMQHPHSYPYGSTHTHTHTPTNMHYQKSLRHEVEGACLTASHHRACKEETKVVPVYVLFRNLHILFFLSRSLVNPLRS